MKFSAVAFGLVGLAAASPLIESRATNNYTGVLADFAIITTDLAKLTSDVAAFTPNDIPGGIAILVDSNNIQNDIKQATNDALNSAPFGKKGSNAVAKAVLNLQKPIYASLQTLINQKPAFQQGIFGIPLTSIVLNQLQSIKNETDTLGAAIVPKLTKSLQSVAPSIIANIDSHFNAAIQAYSS